MSLEQAKKLGADLLRELRYGDEGYFWAHTTEGINVVMYGRKDVEGRSRLESKDIKGKFYVKEMLAKGKAGEGYVEYWFPRKDRARPSPRDHTCSRSNPSDGLSGADTTAERSKGKR